MPGRLSRTRGSSNRSKMAAALSSNQFHSSNLRRDFGVLSVAVLTGLLAMYLIVTASLSYQPFPFFPQNCVTYSVSYFLTLRSYNINIVTSVRLNFHPLLHLPRS
ncbi:hypothetical protein J6590_055999 [Homalodisca vitripennis]|nr:hypothetical protein J6590_055999 [Homalodisca vitripennis]